MTIARFRVCVEVSSLDFAKSMRSLVCVCHITSGITKYYVWLGAALLKRWSIHIYIACMLVCNTKKLRNSHQTLFHRRGVGPEDETKLLH